ncbi:hypothetical protein OUZ56_032671 [Daphnia magna]|uniref:Uncharacterized protein n=1 Tax=Daphnia magna TaxID=35525 RepID=A0ABR0B9K6_9CRUS|nr:hypothetical protein OUZ56_032671 [Daphnia magna]
MHSGSTSDRQMSATGPLHQQDHRTDRASAGDRKGGGVERELLPVGGEARIGDRVCVALVVDDDPPIGVPVGDVDRAVRVPLRGQNHRLLTTHLASASERFKSGVRKRLSHPGEGCNAFLVGRGEAPREGDGERLKARIVGEERWCILQ